MDARATVEDVESPSNVLPNVEDKAVNVGLVVPVVKVGAVVAIVVDVAVVVK